jgi:hypothetical protein
VDTEIVPLRDVINIVQVFEETTTFTCISRVEKKLLLLLLLLSSSSSSSSSSLISSFYPKNNFYETSMKVHGETIAPSVLMLKANA